MDNTMGIDGHGADSAQNLLQGAAFEAINITKRGVSTYTGILGHPGVILGNVGLVSKQ